MDSSYPLLVAETALSMRAVMPTNAVNVRYRTESRCAVVGCYSKNWPILFPQHGPGRKHDRKIELAEWQRAICKAQPRPLIRGLVHSDGCRVVARVMKRGRRYLYPRYYFANQSEDIKRIFCDYLDQLEIPWTRANRKLIQIAHREGVAALDDFVGPKR